MEQNNTPIPQNSNSLVDPQEVFTRIGLEKNMRVADLGCGATGHFVIPSAHIVGEQSIVYAVDIMQPILKNVVTIARQHGLGNVKTVWSNIESVGATNIKAESLDLVLLANVLFQSSSRQHMIEEGLRLLKKGGKLAIIDWRNDAPAHVGPQPESRVQPTSITQFCEKHGCTQSDSFNVGQYHFVLVFEK